MRHASQEKLLRTYRENLGWTLFIFEMVCKYKVRLKGYQLFVTEGTSVLGRLGSFLSSSDLMKKTEKNG